MPESHPNALGAPLGRLRQRLRMRRGAVALAAFVLALAALRLAGVSGTPLYVAATAAVALLAGAVLALEIFRSPDAGQLAEHLNRRFPGLEESVQLLLYVEPELNPVRRLQHGRVRSALDHRLARGPEWLPPAWPRTATWATVAGVLLFLGAPWLREQWPAPGSPTGATAELESPAQLATILTTVTPPAYTGLPAQSGDDLDITLPQGSRVEWRLGFTAPGDFALRFSGGADSETVPLAADAGDHVAGRKIDRTGLYRVVELSEDGDRPLPGIHTLTVNLDLPPKVRIVDPDQATLDIPLDGAPRFEARALASDDYGLGELEIRASVAKGSGEGVKFRDEVFEFDGFESGPDGQLHSREWSLPEIGMEPGDEVYFFVVARDNREPEPNAARSNTVIVRWLDEARVPPASEGIAVDLMPEYFKSQRQIIIETEQLITDRDTLDADAFEDTSRGLGQAQGDLKQRYGQYLGDEFGEGNVAGLPPEAADDAGDDDHHDAAAGGHDHEDEAGIETTPGIDTSGGAAELIARYAHDHGAAEIGPITSRNPVGLMKRSVSNMWQAERHLHLAEPEQALPYEYDALKYLNLARQADRIYTRRLGFEPPPVSEERRLEGELDDILEYQRRSEPSPPDGDAQLFGELVTWLSLATAATVPDDEARALMSRARDRLSELAQQRPALITHAATLEKLLVTGRVSLPDCGNCVSELRDATWSLLPPPAAEPLPGDRGYDPADPLAADYADSLDDRP